jgi:hypothetical protein
LPATEESAESSAWVHLQAFAGIADETFTDVERKTDHREFSRIPGLECQDWTI